MIYSDKAYEIHRLTHTKGYKLIAEIYKENRMIAALFIGGDRNE